VRRGSIPGKRILITGATDGIGLALARRFAPRHDLLLTGRRTEHPSLPDRAAYIQADHADAEGSTRLVTDKMSLNGWSTLDIAILNAGVGFQAADGLDTTERIRATLDINLAAPLALAHALHPALEHSRGTLVLIGSVAHRGAARFPAYAASKAGLEGLARALASEWRGRVRVQMLHPGPVATGMHAKAGHDPGGLARLFTPAETMAAMIERAIASGTQRATLSFAARAAHAILPERRL
jgi:NAD(P)-dependent dehydrogenase (short-subunit alcohol dehydrogenase family)